MTGLSFRHETEWRHANNRRREVRRGSKSELPVGRKQSHASEETSSLDPGLWKNPARGNNFCTEDGRESGENKRLKTECREEAQSRKWENAE